MSKKSAKKGFLLIEMLVAVGIFTVVMLISITAVLSILDVNKKNQSMKSVINNLNLAINGIAKNLTVSKGYYCGIATDPYPHGASPNDYIGDNADCPTLNGVNSEPGDAITMTSNKDEDGDGLPDIIRYRLHVDQDGLGRIERSINDDSEDSFVAVTSPEVDVESLKFYVFNTSPLMINKLNGEADPDSETVQPRVVMVVRGYAGVKEITRTQFNIQTTVSQRALDVVYTD